MYKHAVLGMQTATATAVEIKNIKRIIILQKSMCYIKEGE